jgi:hypothetical protein
MYPKIIPSNPASLKRWEASEDNTFRSKLVVVRLACFRAKMTEKGHPVAKPVAVEMIGALDSGIADEQAEALKGLAESEPQLYTEARAAIYRGYRKFSPDVRRAVVEYSESLGYAADTDDIESWLPRIRKGNELDGLVAFGRIYVGRPVKGVSRIGMDMTCSWDPEHGMGIVLAKGKVKRVGLAGVAFDLGPW